MLSDQDLLAPLRRLAKVSQAKLAKVACFITKNGVIVSSGINYNPSGGPMEELVDGKLVSRPENIHAEVAALQAAATNHVSVEGATMLLTMSPCLSCANEIARTGVCEVGYLYEWWDKAGLDVLRAKGINVKQLRRNND
jgi:dCMP deaminase